MKDDTTENKKHISSVLDLFSVQNFHIRKGRSHGHKYGKKEGCKEFHTAIQLQKRCPKKQCDNIHDRFIRDTWFRKTMFELGHSEEVILEMDRLANEDHVHIATEKVMFFVTIGGSVRIWWIPKRCRQDIDLTARNASRKRRTRRRGGNGKLLGGIPTVRLHHKDGLITDRTGKRAKISESSVCVWHESHKEFGAKFTVIISRTVNAVHCHRRGV